MISRAWSVALVGSGVGHLAFAVVLSMMPNNEVRRGGGARRDQLFTPGAVVPIQTTAVTMMPTPRDRPSVPSDPAAAPFDEPKSPQPSPDGSGSRSDSPTPTDEAPPSESPGLLSGARDKTTGAMVTAPGKVVFDPSMLAGSRDAYEDSAPPDPGVGSGEVQGPAPAPKSDLSFTRSKGKMMYRDPGGRFTATLRSDGRVDFKNKAGKISWTDNAIGDPSALLAKASGQDPYARAKHELLKATFDLRLGMAVAFQKKQLDKRLDRLDGELSKIWADERRDLAARKELLFQRWDECDEPDETSDDESSAEVPGFGVVENSELDEARHDAAVGARKLIEKFIRKNAPTGSAEAFSASELASMNKRRISKQKFEPYE